MLNAIMMVGLEKECPRLRDFRAILLNPGQAFLTNLVCCVPSFLARSLACINGFPGQWEEKADGMHGPHNITTSGPGRSTLVGRVMLLHQSAIMQSTHIYPTNQPHHRRRHYPTYSTKLEAED